MRKELIFAIAFFSLVFVVVLNTASIRSLTKNQSEIVDGVAGTLSLSIENKKAIERMKVSMSPVEDMVAYVNPATDRISKYMDRQDAYKLAVIIYETSMVYGIDPYLFEALGAWESGQWRSVTNGVDWGYWQVNVNTVDLLKDHFKLQKFHVDDPSDLIDPVIGASFGAFYFARQYERFNDYDLAIRAYNAGPGAVIRWRAGRHELNAINKQHFAGVKAIYEEIKPS